MFKPRYYVVTKNKGIHTMNQEIITFSQSTVDALKSAAIDKFAAVATAAREAVDSDRKVTVRCFADSLRAVTVGLGMAQAVLAAAIKAAKDGADIEQAMTETAQSLAKKAREARAKASKNAAGKSTVKALSQIEDNLAKLAGRDKSNLLVEIENQRGYIATLVDDLKVAREVLAELEARYVIEQKTALKSA